MGKDNVFVQSARRIEDLVPQQKLPADNPGPMPDVIGPITVWAQVSLLAVRKRINLDPLHVGADGLIGKVIKVEVFFQKLHQFIVKKARFPPVVGV